MKKMSESTEIVLKLKIAQLENKIHIYESLMAELPKMKDVTKTTNKIKNELKKIVKVWKTYNNKND
jgi:phage shock protein A